MSPRPRKPPADPIEMPRTEGDLDALMRGVERHQGEGHRIGRLVQQKKLSSRQALDQAADADEKLYNLCDTIQQEREKEMEKHGRSAAQQA